MRFERRLRDAAVLVSLAIATACTTQEPASREGVGVSIAASAGGQGAGTSPATGRTPVDRWVTGYYVAYQRDLYPPEAIEWTGLSHIVMGRLKVRPDGSLATDFDVAPGVGPALAREIASRAHAAGRQALLMVGGAGQGAAIRRATTPPVRPAFVRNLVSALRSLDYDGFDLDWEDDVDLARFVALVRDLRAAVPGIVLTVPGRAINATADARIDPEIPRLAALVDQYNLMTYHPATAHAGRAWRSWHNSPLSGWSPQTPVTIEDSLQRYVDAGVPRARLGMGLAFYAICYTGGITGPGQRLGFGVRIRGGDNDFPLAELVGPDGAYATASRRWDARAQCAYLSLSRPDRRGCRYVSLEDEHSIAAKGRFARERGYGGVIIWTINQGFAPASPTGDANTLLKAVGRAFLTRSSTAANPTVP